MTGEDLSDATWVAGLLALCGPALGGALVAEDVAESFVAAYVHAAGPRGALRTIPSSLTADALTGSIDLAATLALGKPIQTQGLLSDDARLLVRRAERLDVACTSLMAQALDRDALLLIAVMNPHDPDAVLAPKLESRLPFRVEGSAEPHWAAAQIALASTAVDAISVDAKWLQDLCEAALSIGVESPRAVLQAVSAARGIAALQV